VLADKEHHILIGFVVPTEIVDLLILDTAGLKVEIHLPHAYVAFKQTFFQVLV